MRERATRCAGRVCSTLRRETPLAESMLLEKLLWKSSATATGIRESLADGRAKTDFVNIGRLICAACGATHMVMMLKF